MVKDDFLSLTPLIIVAAMPVIMMLVIAIRRNFTVVFGLSLAGFILAFLSAYFVLPVIPHTVTPVLIFDGFSLLFTGMILLAGLLVTMLSYRYILYQESEKEEYFIMLFTGILGSLLLAASASFVTFFLGLETLSISLYVLIGYRRSREHSIEAAVKYLILASVSSAFLLFGMGLLYLDTGSLEFSGIAAALQAPDFSTPMLLAGFAMMVVGIGFKLALVPFHMWTPDIYQGAPVPVATFIATISKGAVMAFLLRFFNEIQGYSNPHFVLMITFLALMSMFAGNLLAVRQQNIKRILAYSSIANMGYLLVTLLTGSDEGMRASVFYIISYLITTLGTFGVIGILAGRESEFEEIGDYRGLFWKRPGIALVFTLALLSLAGIPITTGFVAKFYLVFTGIHSGLWLLVTGLILNSVIGLYYYLRIITMLYSTEGNTEFPRLNMADHLFLAVIALGILWLGIFPERLIQLIAYYTAL